MRGVGSEAYRKPSPFVIKRVVIAKMILDVAVFYLFLVILSIELFEHLRIGFFHHVGKHIEPAPVSHSHNYLIHVVLSTARNDGIQRGNNGLGTLERETFLPHEFLMHVIFESGSLDQAIQYSQLFLLAENFTVPGGFHFLLEPTHDLWLGHVPVFYPNGGTVGLFQPIHDIA